MSEGQAGGLSGLGTDTGHTGERAFTGRAQSTDENGGGQVVVGDTRASPQSAPVRRGLRRSGVVEGRQSTQNEARQAGAVVECVGVAPQDPGSEHGQGLSLSGKFREHGQCVGEQGSGSFRGAADQADGSA